MWLCVYPPKDFILKTLTPALESKVHFLSGGFIQALAHRYFYKRKGEKYLHVRFFCNP